MAKMGHNVASPSEAGSFVDKIEELYKEIREIKAANAGKIAKVNAQIKEVLDDAKSQGLAKGVIKATVKERELERKIASLRDDLDADQRDMVRSIREAMGDFKDLPLGAAAVAREEAATDPTTAAIIGAVNESLSVDEREEDGGEDEFDPELEDEF